MKSEWISVMDRLPENTNCCVLGTNGDDISIVYLNDDKTRFYDVDKNREDITHWMPIPPPPEKQRIKFDLDRAKRGHEIVRGDGTPIRIICFDFKNNDYPLVVEYLDEDDKFDITTYTNDGCFSKEEFLPSLDLFMKYPGK